LLLINNLNLLKDIKTKIEEIFYWIDFELILSTHIENLGIWEFENLRIWEFGNLGIIIQSIK